MKRLALNLLFFCICYTAAFAQKGIQYNSEEATPGYSLFSNGSGTYLINNCGEIVRSWNATYMDNHCKILPNGNLIYIKNNIVYERDWDDLNVTITQVTDQSFYLDYEVIKLKNGNYLCLARSYTTIDELEEHGYDIPATYPSVSDIVIEIEYLTGKIVWRWDLLDHVIQDRFSAKLDYGVLSEHPERLNINAIRTYDWTSNESFMINGMDYNEDLDQIVLSVRKLCEIAIIDHSTTTEQAKGTTGGKYNKGGDILYRYGSPNNYDRGAGTTQQLYFQHNPNWIKYGPHKGKIILFNNMLSTGEFSHAQIIGTPINSDGSYRIEAGKPFEPTVPDLKIGNDQGDFKSGYTSGAKVLPNGHVAFTIGQTSSIYEVDPADNSILWHYNIQNAYYIFRTERYDPSYPAFVGRNMEGTGNYVESPQSTYNCMLYSSQNEVLEQDVDLYQTPNLLQISANEDFQYQIFDFTGRSIYKGTSLFHQAIINHDRSPQIAVLQITINGKTSVKKIIL